MLTRPSGATTSFGYDACGRCVGASDGAGNVAFARDALGRTVLTTENGKTLRRTFDASGRMISFVDPNGNTIGYEYDLRGRLTRLVYPDGRSVRYEYDAAGRLVKVSDWADRVTVYIYDADGRIMQVTRPNGTKLVQAYDAAGQLTHLSETAPDGTALLYSADFDYDAGGQLTKETLFPPVNVSVLDSVQNFDRDNRLVNLDGLAQTFDGNGNLLSITGATGAESLEFDARNRLIRAGARSFSYDAENRRIQTTASAGVTRDTYSPLRPYDQLLVRRGPDGTETYYVYGIGLLHEERLGVARYYHFSRRGDVVALTDASGVVTARMNYGPYGERVGGEGEMSTPFQFNGRWGVQTDEDGLCFMRARYYHPGIRRFLSEDSLLGDLSRPATMNRYAFTRGNPVGYIDPSGRYDRDVHYDLTLALAMHAGFPREDAEEIASADQSLDDDLLAGPFLNPFARRKFHFTTEGRREAMLRDANEAGDLAKFGYYLHAEQDSYSHQSGETDRDGEPDGWLFGHLFEGHSPDQTIERPELAVKMVERTYRQLRKFYEQTNGKQSCDDWDNIKPIIETWVRTER
jgi:RHS repeat-associated protein